MSTYSSNLRLELIGTGEQQGTWGITTNTNLGTLLEQAITGYVAVAVTDGTDTTLTVANGATDQSRNMTLNLTGSLSAARTVICPSTPKIYIVKNGTTGGYAVTFKVTGQTGVSIPNGSTVVVYVDGTDARLVSQFPVPVTLGGTGATSSTGSGSVVLSSSPTLVTPALGTPSSVTLTNATGLPIVAGTTGTLSVARGGTGVTTSTGTGNTVLSASPTLTGTPLLGANKIDAFPSGTRMLFQQTSAPTGWTKDTSQNDKALRVVSGSVGTGGSVGFSTAFSSRSISGSTNSQAQGGTVNATTITTDQMPSHTHVAYAALSDVNSADSQGWVNPATQSNKAHRSTDRNPSYPINESTGIPAMSSTGGGQSHSHSFSPNSHSHTVSASLDMSVTYVDVIIAQKD